MTKTRKKAKAEVRSLWQISRELSKAVSGLRFSAPVTHVYNPLEYAAASHRRYLELYGQGPKEALFLGMNPGPWGMAQTGVPFGEVELVREWLGIEEAVERPRDEHPKRPVEGFECSRREVSGRRLWGWARDTFGEAPRFFERFFVGNYCPLIFLEESGRNRTPDRLPKAEREDLFAVCDEALRRTVEALGRPKVVGVGRFAEQRARAALGELGVEIGRVLHPSPASPAANAGWAEQAEKDLSPLGLLPGR